MLRDERGLALSTDSSEAARLFDRAVKHHLWWHHALMAEARIGDTGHLQLVPHLLMALAATGRAGQPTAFLRCCARKAPTRPVGRRRQSPIWCFRSARRRSRCRVTGVAAGADPASWWQQRAARRVLPVADRCGDESRAPRRRWRNDRPRNRNPSCRPTNAWVMSPRPVG